MIDENIYNILISSIAHDMQSLNKNFYISLDKLRKEIIKTHRTISLMPYYIYIIDIKHHQQKPPSNMPIISDSDLMLSLFKPKENPSFPEISMIAQDVSFLINYFESNPSELAREVVNSKSTTENINYYHLIYQVIPSLFGFFHSFEHLSLASRFYQSVIDIISDNPKDSIRILQPFLNTPSTYRYIEYVMTKFFKKMVLCKSSMNAKDTSFLDENSYEYSNYISCRNKNTKKLLYYLTKGLSLLPDPILEIFRLIKTKYNDKWSIKNWYKLVFSIFINPHVTRWARSRFFNIDHNLLSLSPNRPKMNEKDSLNTPYSTIPNLYQLSTVSLNSPSRSNTDKLDQINNILSNVLNDNFRAELDTFLNALCTVQSTYNPPQMYKCFSNFSIQYYMMINDFIIFIDLLKSRNILPSFIKYELVHEIPEKYRTISFYLNVYQSAKPKKVIKIENPIVFPHIDVNPDDLNKFENQVEYRSRLASLELLADSENKNKMIFSLEKSVSDPDFHRFVMSNIIIQLSNSADMFEEYIEARRIHDEIEKWEDVSFSSRNFLFRAYLHNLHKFPTAFDLLPRKVKLLNQLSLINEKELLEHLNQLASFSGEWDGFIHRITSIEPLPENETKKREQQQENHQKNVGQTNQEPKKLFKKNQELSQHQNNLMQQSPKKIQKKQQVKLQKCSSEPHPKNQMTKSRSSPNVGLIEQKHIKFVEKLNYFDEVQQLPLYFLKALSIFSQITVVNLPEKYELLMQFLVIVEQFFPKEDNNLYFFLIQRIPGSILIKIFIEISTVAIHNDICYNFIPNNEKYMWQRFENLIYEIATKNNAIFQKILKCQFEFQKIFEAWKNSLSNKRPFTRRNRSLSFVG